MPETLLVSACRNFKQLFDGSTIPMHPAQYAAENAVLLVLLGDHANRTKRWDVAGGRSLNISTFATLFTVALGALSSQAREDHFARLNFSILCGILSIGVALVVRWWKRKFCYIALEDSPLQDRLERIELYKERSEGFDIDRVANFGLFLACASALLSISVFLQV
ncbi:hypothetical protein BC834DRAFT_971215 [Gloeopeniophorella convolvens]|nr:hypothetical protein BC834DRAFT_971215 [Gloeopeniophorella convolvens]